MHTQQVQHQNSLSSGEQDTGEPDAAKVASPVRRGAVGKGPRKRDLAGCLPYIPWRAWPPFEQAFDAAQSQLRSALAPYEADYLAIRTSVVSTFAQLAADSARRLQATGQPVAIDFEETVVREVMAALPEPDLLWRSLSLRYRIGVLHLGSEFLTEQRRAAQERRRIEAIAAESRVARERELAEQRLVQEELFAAQERLRQQQRAEEEDREREAAIKQRLRQLKLEAARERLQETLSPLEEGARQLHAAVFEAASMIQASLQKRGSLHGSSARKARELSRLFRLMAWQGDDQLEVLLGELERLASTPAARRKRETGSLDQVLSSIVALTYADARALAEPNRMAVSSSDESPELSGVGATTSLTPHITRGGFCMTIAPNRELPATEALILSLDEYIRARYGVIAVQTFEEERFLRFMRGVAEHERHRAKGLYTWSRSRGLRLIAGPGVGPEPRPIPNREDALSVIEYVEEAEQGLYVLSDFAPYLLEYGAPKPELVRRLRELAWAIRSRPVTVIFLGARFPEIPELEKEVKVLDLPLPEEAETADILERETERLRANPSARVELEQDARANLIQALLGLTVTEMENVLAKAAVRDRGFSSNTARLVLDEKRDLIRKTGALTFTPPVPIDDVGGYQPIRRLLRLAALTFTPEARAFGVEEAKGLLLVGLPGCGKDLIARAASSVLGRALLQLDLGAAMGEGGGLLGSAELSIKRALQIATTAKCVLAISEYEKAVGGMQSSARTDGGATSRVVGSLLSWLADPHPGVFVIATANDVRELAPEQIREGRFTPVFVDLPGAQDRAEIFAVHLRKRRRDPTDFDLEQLSASSEGYSGAEIESAVKTAVLEAFEDGRRALRSEDIVRGLGAIRPLSQVKPAEIEDLRLWAREALAVDANRGTQVGADVRTLEL